MQNHNTNETWDRPSKLWQKTDTLDTETQGRAKFKEQIQRQPLKRSGSRQGELLGCSPTGVHPGLPGPGVGEGHGKRS